VNTISLVRHGQASYGAENYDQLSSVGYEQAGILGRAWADASFRPAVSASGSLMRHRQTAEGALATAGLPVDDLQIDEDWNEIDTRELMVVAYPDFEPPAPGTATPEQTVAYLEAFIKAVRRWTSGAYDSDYSVAFATFIGRIRGALERVAAQLEPDQDAVVFTSGGPVSACAGILLDDPVNLWPQFCTIVVNASVTKVVNGPRGLRLLSFNEHAHLSEFTYI
jgi:broad specificity phosphatase PhoE